MCSLQKKKKEEEGGRRWVGEEKRDSGRVVKERRENGSEGIKEDLNFWGKRRSLA